MATTSLTVRARRTRAHPVLQSAERVLFYAVTTIIVVATLFPLYWMFVTAARKLEENGDFPPLLWPQAWDWTPYVTVFKEFALATWLLHSLEVGFLVTILVIVFATLAAYP